MAPIRSPLLRSALLWSLPGTVLLVLSCTAPFRVVRYGHPDTHDYQIFANDTVKKGDKPYQIPISVRYTSILDTLTLRHPVSQQSVPLETYLAQTQTKAFLILQNDSLVYEQYRDGYTPATIHGTFSVSKSIISVIAGAALSSFPEMDTDTPISVFIPELTTRDPYFQQLTLQDLFAMKSGLSYSTFDSWKDVFCDNNLIYYTSDQKRYIQNAHFAHIPGEKRQYKSYDPVLVAWVIEHITDQSISAFFSAAVWKKIGAEYDAYWSVDRRGGLVKAASSFHCTAPDLAKIGLLYLHQGYHQGVEIIPASWIERTVGAHTLSTHLPVLDTWWQPAQSYFWWFSTHEPVGDYYADGYKGQFLYINPRTRTVIVKFSDVGDEFHDMPFRKIAESLGSALPPPP